MQPTRASRSVEEAVAEAERAGRRARGRGIVEREVVEVTERGAARSPRTPARASPEEATEDADRGRRRSRTSEVADAMNVEIEADEAETDEPAADERRRSRSRGRRQGLGRACLAAPIAVAITGGIGAGKSTALEAFRAHGAATVSSDEIVHHLLATDDDVRDALVERLGDGDPHRRPPRPREDRAGGLRRPRAARVARRASAPARLARVPHLARPARRARRAAARLRDRGAAALRGRAPRTASTRSS